MNNNLNILDLALKQLKAIDNSVIDFEVEDNKNCNKYLNHKILKIKYNQSRVKYCLDIKKSVTNTMIGFIKLCQNNLPFPYIVITTYINPKIAERFKNAGIQFIDTVGNIYIKNSFIYIYTKGNKLEKQKLSGLNERIFTKNGLRIIYALLTDNSLVNDTYRDISAKVNVALGTVNSTINNLKQMGYIIDINNLRKLVKKKELFQRWCIEYPEILKPKLFLGRFIGDKKLQNLKISNYKNVQWGGELAAEMITKYLKPQNVMVYLEAKSLKQFIVKNKLKKSNNGNIECYERFWINKGNDEFVHPILIYADLLATGNERNIETAKIIYEKNLKYLEKD